MVAWCRFGSFPIQTIRCLKTPDHPPQPPEAINVLNDLIRSENELNEHRFWMRQLSAAQQSLTAALGQLIQVSGVEPLSDAGESNPLVGDDSKDMEAA